MTTNQISRHEVRLAYGMVIVGLLTLFTVITIGLILRPVAILVPVVAVLGTVVVAYGIGWIIDVINNKVS